MNEVLNVLCLEDSPRDAEIMRELLIDAGYNLNMDCTALEKEFVSLLRNHKYDIILSDFKLPGFDGFAALRWSVEICPDVPFICVSGTVGEETAIELLKKGAVDYILKDRLVRLPSVIQRAIEQHNIQIEKRAAELSLKENEEKLKSIFSAAPMGIGLLVGRVFIEANDTFCNMTGYNRSELIGKNADQIFAKDEQNESAGIVIYRHIAEKGTGSVETRFKRKDGKILDIFLSSTPLDKDDLKKGVTFIAMDITQRKRTEATIINERRMLRALIDNLPDMIYVKDHDCRKVISNKADVRNIGFAKESEVLGKTDIELFKGQTGQRGFDDDKKVIDSGKAIVEREEDFVNDMGVRRWLLTTKIPLHDKDGRITGLVGIGHDITERKLSEEELIIAKNKAEEGDKLKTAFLHNISHEIRTPMNAIVGFSALLGEPDVDTQSRKDYIEVIMQSSNHLLAIISDIMDISNIEANLVKNVKNSININSVLKSLCDQFLPKANEKKNQLICETDVPDSDASILTDRTKLTQILTNLINNAIKFTDKGNVKIGCVLKDKFLEFSISDTGIGIPLEYHTKIFDRFYQVQNTLTRLYEGTGLGLAISKANVELVGGEIWLTSEPGKGTSFFFTIPYEKQVAEPIAANEKGVADNYVFPVKKTILVAEDVDSNFKLITYFLSKTNTNIIRAINGKEAVEKCLSNKDVDLIIMDIKMPVMDGYTAVKLVRETNTAIPIIAQTAYADERDKAIEYGCSGFISKPFDKKSLLRVIHEFI